MQRRTLAVAAAVLVAAAISACGSSDKKTPAASDATTTTAAAASTGVTSAGTGENAHACDLLTVADIQAALSVAVGAGSPVTQASVTACTFQSADHNTNVHVLRYEQGDDLLKNIRAADANAKTVTGIGDDAVVEPDIGTIATTIGSIGIKISVDAATDSAKLEQLAKAAVNHFNNP